MDSKTAEKLKKLQEDYAKKLPNKILDIENQWRALSLEFNLQAFVDFHRAIHSLCGSSATYGYGSLSKVARHLEIYLKQLLTTDSLNPTQKSEISHLLENMKEAVLNIDAENSMTIEVGRTEANNKLIYFYNQNESFENELKTKLEQLGYNFILIADFEDFKNKIKEKLPGIIVIDACHLNDEEILYLTNFRKKINTPLICIAAKDDLITHLKAIRAGASMFLLKPLDISYFTRLIDQLCAYPVDVNYRILVLDDSESLMQYYSLVLKEAGMSVRGITDPMKLVDELNDFRPDLLLMDLYMPGCTGLELAAILRQNERYASLPIIFISTEDDKFKQLAAINAGGGDDFLTKPVLPEHLISAVKSRAKRSALLLSYITRDSLTGLLNHTYFLQQLELEILRAKRENQSFAFAMLDLDHFKKINDTYGHPIGDVVLRKVSECLSTRLRKTDFIGRYGGEEFAVIFPNTTLNDAVKICDEIREIISTIEFSSKGKKFHVSVSVGMSAYPVYQTTDSLVVAADQALYKAKSEGRNRIVSG